jgi:hypothetical protein
LEIALDPHHKMLAIEIHSELWRRMQRLVRHRYGKTVAKPGMRHVSTYSQAPDTQP